LEELLALFSDEDFVAKQVVAEPAEPDELQVLLSVAAISGQSASHTMRFEGHLGAIPLRILLDSGSTHTFISSSVEANYSKLQPLSPPIQVHVANGQVLTCS
jgi:hypothetical protein